MPEQTAASTDVRSAFESTHHRLRRLVKQLAANGAAADEDLQKEIKRSQRQIRSNRELLGAKPKSKPRAKRRPKT
jgi:hypothetical protein